MNVYMKGYFLTGFFSPITLESGDISEKMAFENRRRHDLRDNKLLYYAARFHKCLLHNKEIQRGWWERGRIETIILLQLLY